MHNTESAWRQAAISPAARIDRVSSLEEAPGPGHDRPAPKTATTIKTVRTPSYEALRFVKTTPGSHSDVPPFVLCVRLQDDRAFAYNTPGNHMLFIRYSFTST